MTIRTIEELNRLYEEAETTDSKIFAEQKSNVLLASGDHYTRKLSRYWDRLREAKNISREQRIRITKNHIHKITGIYRNNITSFAPGITFMPCNESELQDQKSAEMHNSVWEFIKKKYKLRKEQKRWVHDYIVMGEVFVKVFFDPAKGEFLGMQEGEDGNPEELYSGEFQFERVFGFNLLRDVAAKSFEECRHMIIRKMVDKKILLDMVGDDEEKKQMIKNSARDTFRVFDCETGGYEEVKNKIMVREYYFRPSVEYPEGYYFYTTEAGILFEGELPLGIFPIIYCGFDEVATSCRHRSIIKQLRPYQSEINRCSSKIAEHQITLGDDKILTQTGSKIQQGGTVAGVRNITYNSGMPPTILAGRSGEQYVGYLNGEISGMYEVANVREDSAEVQSTMDPYTLLFRSIRDKKKFSLYAEAYEDFLIELGEITLKLAKAFLPEEVTIEYIGRKEAVNISEFKNTDDVGYDVKIEAQLNDIETKMGKQLTLNHILQYTGNNLQREDVGMVIKNMPYVNEDKMFSDLTIDYESAVNIILALDRGEKPYFSKYDNHKYLIKKLTSRVRQADFRQLDQQIQQTYQGAIQHLEKLEAKIQQDIQAANSGYIPSGGALIAADMYVQSDPKNPLKTRRARVPSEALVWLLGRLEKQGSGQKQLQALGPAVQAETANMITEPGGNVPKQPPAQGPVLQPQS